MDYIIKRGMANVMANSSFGHARLVNVRARKINLPWIMSGVMQKMCEYIERIAMRETKK